MKMNFKQAHAVIGGAKPVDVHRGEGGEGGRVGCKA